MLVTSNIPFSLWANVRLLLLITMVSLVIVITRMSITGSGKLKSDYCIFNSTIIFIATRKYPIVPSSTSDIYHLKASIIVHWQILLGTSAQSTFSVGVFSLPFLISPISQIVLEVVLWL